jgi:insulysin
LNSHGGNSNAFTDLEDTNYYFDVTAASLEGALDRFAQFFIAPLFTESATQREAQAVDSEHSKNLQNDYWRLDQLAKSLAKPDHPYNHFGTGNLETLMRDPNIRDALVEFHAKHYSANLMKLVVLGADSMETLQTWVETYFSAIPNHNLPIPRFPSTPFDKLPICVKVVPVREHIMLDISFQLREVATLYRSKPARYLSHLLGHEGKGSILAMLKEKHWANELSAGESRSCLDWSSFSLSIDLTPEGLKHWQEVVEVVFAYLALLRQAGTQQWIHEETATVAQMQFQFLSKRNPMSFVSSLAGWMHHYPSKHFLSGPYKIYDFEPEHIKEVRLTFNLDVILGLPAACHLTFFCLYFVIVPGLHDTSKYATHVGCERIRRRNNRGREVVWNPLQGC